MNTRIVISKKLNGAPVSVTIGGGELAIQMTVDDFIANLAKNSAADLAKAAAKYAGSPAMLLTNAQLSERLVSSIAEVDVTEVLLKHAKVVIDSAKHASVVAE